VLQACTVAPGTTLDINTLRTGQIASSRIWVDDVAGFDTADLTGAEIDDLRPHVYRWSAQENASTGYHKIHDAYHLTREGRPIIDDAATRGAVYIIRNPLDVAPSFAAHMGTDIDTAIARMGDPGFALSRTAQGLSAQLCQWLGRWSDHVTSWLEAPGLSLHVMRYEDMLARPEDTFGAALAFLQQPADSERVARAVRLCRFEALARQEAAQGFSERSSKSERFFRQGRAGGWRDVLSTAQAARVVADHGPVMARFGYLDADGHPA
jgi:hypothetical protein